MSNSIVTNPEAFVALRNLERTNEKLSKTQERLSTGLKVTSATDDASNFAIAQGVRGDVRALGAITQGLNNSKGIGEIALAGVTAISDLLQDIRQKLTELANGGLTTAQRVIVKADFDKLMSQAYGFVSNSNFNGRNLLISNATNVNTISNLNGTNLTLTARSGASSGVTHLIRSLAAATLGTNGAASNAENAQSVIIAQYAALEVSTSWSDDFEKVRANLQSSRTTVDEALGQMGVEVLTSSVSCFITVKGIEASQINSLVQAAGSALTGHYESGSIFGVDDAVQFAVSASTD